MITDWKKLNMRHTHLLAASLTTLLTISPAWAMDGMGGSCAAICVDYSISAQGVPLSPAAMAVLALVVGVAGLAMLRTRMARSLGVLFAGGLAAALLLQHFDDARAASAPMGTINFSSGRPAYPITFTGAGYYMVTNNIGQNATITNITLADGYALNSIQTTCQIGMLLAPSQTCIIAVTGARPT
jgi:hypothetical protein